MSMKMSSTYQQPRVPAHGELRVPEGPCPRGGDATPSRSVLLQVDGSVVGSILIYPHVYLTKKYF